MAKTLGVAWWALVGLLLALQVWWSLPATPAGRIFVDTVPRAAQVFQQRSEAAISFAGQGSGGVRQVRVGTSPGPLQLDYQDFPATLIFELPLYKPLVRTFPAGTFDPDHPRYSSPLHLEANLPMVAPALYWLRDQPWLALALLLVGWRQRLGQRRRKLQRERQEMAVRHSRGEFHLGDTVGDYRLLELLGEGGMGQVYRVAQADGGEELALKILRRALDHPAARARWESEVRLCMRLRHPNLVHLYSWGELGNSAYLVMELVRGQPLSKWSGVSRQQVLEWGIQVARALIELHRLGIVHRDVKPSNILVGTDRVARLLDLGIAQEAGAEVSAALQGTAGYMAPEQKEGGDWRSDFYGLACTLYRLLADHDPFGGATPLQILQKQERGEFQPLNWPLDDWMARDPGARKLETPEQALGLLEQLRAL